LNCAPDGQRRWRGGSRDGAGKAGALPWIRWGLEAPDFRKPDFRKPDPRKPDPRKFAGCAGGGQTHRRHSLVAPVLHNQPTHGSKARGLTGVQRQSRWPHLPMTPLLRIIALSRRHAAGLWLGVAISLASVAAGVALMTLSGAAVAAVLTGAVLTAPLWLRVVGPARVVLRYLERLVSHGATFRAIADLRVWFFRGFAARAAGGLGFRQAGDLLSRLVADIEALDGLYLRILLPLAGAVFVVPAAALLTARVGWWVGVGVGVLFAMAAFVLPAVVARDAVRNGAGVAQAASGLRIAALDMFTGLREVRAFGAESRMQAQILAQETALVERQRGAATRIAWANAAAMLCGQAAILIVLAATGAPPLLQVGCVFLLVGAFEPLSLLPRAGVVAGAAAEAARRVLDVAEGAAPMPEPATPKRLPVAFGLRFEGVHFRWAANAPVVLDGLTMEIPAGSHVAVLGPSGAGKSTLAALALKVAAPEAGRVLLGGVDIADLAAADLRRRIAWVGQTSHIFDDTIANNIRLGRPEATEAELWRALDRAEIGDWVRGLPDRLETWLGEGGAMVSGGQGRRIALARAWLSEAPLLILDEPCTGLDAATERAFLTTLFAEAQGRTILLIAHRLTGAEKLDRIWRLSGGHAMAAAA
jgi:ATP-binding cassette subfamily C protein CydC